MRYLSGISTVLILPFAFLVSPQSTALQPNNVLTTARPKALCRIEVDYVHPSSYLANRGIRAIKVNARSICNVEQEKVELAVQLFKTGLFFDHFVTSSSTSPNDPKSQGLRVENNGTFAICKNSKRTEYYGVAFAQAIIAGERVSAPPARSVKKYSSLAEFELLYRYEEWGIRRHE